MKNFFQEIDGEWSTLRPLMVLWMVVVLGVWTYVSYINKKVEEIPTGLVALLGILVTGKVVQRAVLRFAARPRPTDPSGKNPG